MMRDRLKYFVLMLGILFGICVMHTQPIQAASSMEGPGTFEIYDDGQMTEPEDPADSVETPSGGGAEATPASTPGPSGGAGTSTGTGSTGSGKGLLPQTAEFLANNWLIILGILILLNLIAWQIRNRYYDRKK